MSGAWHVGFAIPDCVSKAQSIAHFILPLINSMSIANNDTFSLSEAFSATPNLVATEFDAAGLLPMITQLQVRDAQESADAASVGLGVSSAVNLINGTAGNDQLIGSSGDEEIFGGAGDDILNGGSGSDTLSGGEGQDIFILAPGEGPDTIVDFVEGVDAIQLAGGLTSERVTMTQQGSNTFIRVAATNELLAILTGAPPLQIIDTPDVSFMVI